MAQSKGEQGATTGKDHLFTIDPRNPFKFVTAALGLTLSQWRAVTVVAVRPAQLERHTVELNDMEEDIQAALAEE